MRIFVAALFAVLLVSGPIRPLIAPSEAAELRTTNRKHYSTGPSQTIGGGFTRAGTRFRTRVVQGQRRGIIAQDDKPLTQAATFELEASLACREGRLRRLGGGIAAFGNNRYAAGRKRDMSRIQGVELGDDVYIFVNESSTACRVYSYGG